MAKITIEVGDGTIRLIRSPVYWVVATLTGVSVTFAPLLLFFLGGRWSDMFSDYVKWVIIVLCFLAIYLVPMFYIKVSSGVISEVLKK